MNNEECIIHNYDDEKILADYPLIMHYALCIMH